jgi:hypothetical protein
MSSFVDGEEDVFRERCQAEAEELSGSCVCVCVLMSCHVMSCAIQTWNVLFFFSLALFVSIYLSSSLPTCLGAHQDIVKSSNI